MRVYVLITGTLFAMIVVAHIARMAAEGLAIAKDPFFALATVIAGAMSAWAFLLVRQAQRPGDHAPLE